MKGEEAIILIFRCVAFCLRPFLFYTVVLKCLPSCLSSLCLPVPFPPSPLPSDLVSEWLLNIYHVPGTEFLAENETDVVSAHKQLIH